MRRALQKIKEFAATSHGQQWRKFADEPYINHPIRVMEICQRYTNNESILAAALLHDVLEDTEIGKDELHEFLYTVFDREIANQTLTYVEELTDVYIKSRYPQWNRRKRKTMEVRRLQKVSPEAQTIKYADIIDNSLDLKNAEPDFAKLYLHECNALLKDMIDGNSELHKLAIATVKECHHVIKRRI